MTCNNCGAQMEPDDNFCPVCGISSVEAESGGTPPLCPNCGAPVDEDYLFCQMCGARVASGTDHTDDPTIPPNGSFAPLSPNAENNTQIVGKKRGTGMAMIMLVILSSMLFLVGGLFYFRRDLLFHHVRTTSPSSSDNGTGISSYSAGPASSVETVASAPSAEEEFSSKAVDVPYHAQMIHVKSDGSKARLRLEIFDEETAQWKQVLSAAAYIGKNGISAQKAEGDKCTPAGTFDIMFVFGTSKPDTALTFKKVDENTVWIDDSASAYYNTWQSAGADYKDWTSCESMMKKFADQKVTYRIAFGFNGDCLSKNSAQPGKGSAIFLEGAGADGKMEPGYGEIRISADDMTTLLRYLDSDKHPQIEIS